MNRETASRLLHEELVKHNLLDWHVRLTTNDKARFLGLCSYKDKCIILNAHHIEIHPDPDIIDTIKHEVAHAIMGPSHGHDELWAAKAKEIGCSNTQSCSHLALSPDVIDAIRSGATVEMTYEEEVIRRPAYKITRLQEKCPTCGKVAITVKESFLENTKETLPDMLLIKLECGHTIIKDIPKGTPFHKFQAFGDPLCDHQWSKTEVNTCVICGRKRPYPFQLDGMRACEKGVATGNGFAFLDEMGLGKTIQVGGYLYFHSEMWPVLWVVKKVAKFQTFKFIIDWMGEEHVAQIIHNSGDILIPSLKHYIISYDLMVMKNKRLKNGKIITVGFDPQKIVDSKIKTIVLDECQQIKNVDSGRTKAIKRIAKGRIVLPLSGTPWKNRGNELFPMFQLIAPMKFPYYQRFIDTWVDFFWQGKFKKLAGIKNPEIFREYVKDICIRRERKDVMPELPLVTRTKLLANFTKDEEAAYDIAVEEFLEWLRESQEEAGNSISILGKMSKMRHIVGIAKIRATLAYVEEFIEDTDRKLVIFAHHKDVQESLYMQCKERFELGKKSEDSEDDEDGEREKIPVLKLTASMSDEARFDVCNKFNSLKRAILVASELAAGESLNLQTCADCIMHERQWNPANEEQAEGRFIRIGQLAKMVNAIYTQLVDSFDEYLDAIVERKRLFFHKTMNKGEAPRWSESEILMELIDVMRAKHNRKKGRAA